MNAPASFTLAANATASNSTMGKVEFYADNILINTDTTAPYTYQWNNVLPGTHSLAAIVTNALGKTAMSSAVNVTVTATALQTYYIHSDHLDTPRVITDTAGNKVWEWQNTDPFGDNLPDENPSGRGKFTYNPRFAGQYLDKETNTHYNYYRDAYDPTLGRYTQFDPIGLAGGVNGYGYVLQNPLKYVDPTGESAATVAGACVLVATSTYFVYKYNKFVKCVKQCSMCPNNPTGDPNIACKPPQGDGNTGPQYSCRTYCTLDAFSGPRSKGAEGSRDYP